MTIGWRSFLPGGTGWHFAVGCAAWCRPPEWWEMAALRGVGRSLRWYLAATHRDSSSRVIALLWIIGGTCCGRERLESRAVVRWVVTSIQPAASLVGICLLLLCHRTGDMLVAALAFGLLVLDRQSQRFP